MLLDAWLLTCLRSSRLAGMTFARVSLRVGSVAVAKPCSSLFVRVLVQDANVEKTYELEQGGSWRPIHNAISTLSLPET